MGKDKSRKGSKSKHRSKDKKRHKKEKKSKHHGRSSSPSSDSSVGGRLDVTKRLHMGRAAARATREILAHDYGLRKELRQLVCQLDSGSALEVSGIPDAFLRSRLLTLFDNLVQLRKNSAGQYFKRQRADATVLSFVAPILEEGEEQLAPYRAASKEFAAAAAASEQQQQREAAARAEEQQRGAAAQQGQQHQRNDTGSDGRAEARQQGPAQPPPGAQAEVEGLASDSSGSASPRAALPAGPIGPAMPAQDVSPALGLIDADDVEDAAADRGVGGGSARVAGPAMPPAEWLAAAAQMDYPVSEGEEGEGEGEEDFLVGPPPPEVALELDLASMDERSAEVSRVLLVLAKYAAQHADSTPAQRAADPVDSYEVLGLDDGAVAGEVKKRYWRLSLLIHPDKCSHPQAHDAFQAVTAAAKELQDASLRKKVDERRQEAELRREFAAAAAQAERERQWRVARGQATAEDLAGPVKGAGPLERDTWMTDLPPERRADAGPSMPSGPFTGFSQKGLKSRGDTSAWTLTPQQRAAQLEGGPAAGPLMLTSGSGGAGGADRGVAAANPAQAARMAAAVDAFNSTSRKKSLVELHAERMAAAGEGGAAQGKSGSKKRKKAAAGVEGKGGAAAQDLGYDPAVHPWRPFNRETDLGPGLDARQSAAELLKGTRALSSKFGGGQGAGRTFL